METRSAVLEILPFGAMVMTECLDVGLTTLSKAAMEKGMSHFVFVVYSNGLATLLLFPLAFLFQRTRRPPLTFLLICKFCLLSLSGITIVQNCVFTGVNYSSPTVASAMSNLVPAFTFLLAVTFRMEKLNFRSSRSLIKILGTLVSIAGALIVILYKGPEISISLVPSSSIDAQLSLPSSPNLKANASNWVLGGLLCATASLSLSVWNTFQAAVLKGYSSQMTIIFFYCLFGTLQCSVISMLAEKNPNTWKLKPDIELFSILYSAIFGSVVTFSVQTWCISKKGPVFVAMFKPLGIAIAALMGVIFLGQALHIGSVVGATVIVSGFYAVIWAQSKEKLKIEEYVAEADSSSSSSSSQKDPFLHTHRDVKCSTLDIPK